MKKSIQSLEACIYYMGCILLSVFIFITTCILFIEFHSSETVYADEETIIDIESNIVFDLSSIVIEKKQQLSADMITEMPNITIHIFSHNTMLLIGGTCEDGSVIHVSGGIYDIDSKSDHGDFLVEVPFSEDKPAIIKLYASKGGKTDSDIITFIVRPQKGIMIFENKGIYGTIVGLDYQCFFQDGVPDYTGANILTEADIKGITERTENKIKSLRAKGCDTEIIYLLIPNPMNIYSELVPLSYTRNNSINSRTKQFTEAVTAGGAKVIDLTDTMLAHKDEEYKIYHKTDSHWTEYGALLGYIDLMNYISQKYPDAAPRSLSDFKIYNKQMYVGDIQLMITEDKPGGIGFKRTDLRETTTFVDFLFDAPTGHPNVYVDNNVMLDHNVTGYEHTTFSNIQGELPAAYIMRDSFGGPFYAFLTDRFSSAYWRGWQTYDFNLNEISQMNPDYVIYIITERNIKNVMYE